MAGGAALTAVLGPADAELERVEFRTTLSPALARLPGREQSQIGQRLGRPQMHVSRLLPRTLTQLRQELRED